MHVREKEMNSGLLSYNFYYFKYDKREIMKQVLEHISITYHYEY